MKDLPSNARRVTGFQLRRVQRGLEPNDWKPMSSIGAGVREIRIHTGLEHRVVYVATFPEAVYVIHAFEKKSQQTTAKDIRVARQRFRELVITRSADYGPKK